MKQSELVKWKEVFGFDLTLGSMVKIKPTCKYYEAEYDKFTKYMVTYLYVDSGGLNIGVNEGGTDNWICSTDGYRVDEIEPALIKLTNIKTLTKE